MERLTLTFEGRELAFEPADTVLDALLRNGERPTPGGTLCCAGDCANCIATVDGVSYVRTCQVAAIGRPTVERHPSTGPPPLPAAPTTRRSVVMDHLTTDLMIIGYPGRTLRYLSSVAVEERQGFQFPKRRDILLQAIKVLEEAVRYDAEKAIKLTATIASLANVEKNQLGMVMGLALSASINAPIEPTRFGVFRM